MLRYLAIALLMVVHIHGYSLNSKVRRARAAELTTVYVNGKIYTVDKSLKDWSLEPKDCMVVTGEKIVFIGNQADAKDKCTKSAGNKFVDLKGNTVLPGLHDVHMHPLEAMNPMQGTCTVSSVDLTRLENVVDEIKKCSDKQIGTDWVLGYGHSIHHLLDHLEKGGKDPKLVLDEALSNTPCVLMEETSHSVWVNSEALRRAGYTKDSPNPPGGVIMKNLNTGEPNGILLENCGNLMLDLAMENVTEGQREIQEKVNHGGLIYAMHTISSHGITSICDARVYWKRGHLKAWKEACNNNELTTRSVLGLWAYPAENDADQIKELKKRKAEYDNNPNCFMKVNQIKFYSDGVVDSTTAALLAPYNINLHLQGIPDNKGMNYFTESRMRKYLQELQSFGNNDGFDFHVHTIGDRGVREILNAIEATRVDGTRHRLTHLEYISLQDVPRFKDLNVIADFQVAGDFTLPSVIPEITHVIGEKRAKTNFLLVKQVLDTGAKTVLSSDWDVSTLNPFVGIGHAVDRGKESVTIKQAVEMYTINAAYVMRHEDITGSLEVGKAADFVIIDQDILTVDKRYINETEVQQTVLAGETMYTKKGFTGGSCMVTSTTLSFLFMLLRPIMALFPI